MNTDKLYVVVLDNEEDDSYIWSGYSPILITFDLEQAKSFAKDKKNWRDTTQFGRKSWDVPHIQTWNYDTDLKAFVQSKEPEISYFYDGTEHLIENAKKVYESIAKQYNKPSTEVDKP